MKNTILILLTLLLTAALACALAEEAPTVYTCGDYEYILPEDGTAMITGYSGKAEELAIPEELDGYRVTSIGNYAFAYRSSLTSIFIPDSVTSIGANPFYNCEKLTSFYVSPTHPTLAVIDGVLLEKTSKTLICYPYAFTAKSYTIPEGIQFIGDSAFYGCYSLTSISIPNTVSSIGEKAFYYCRSLTSISVSLDHPTLATIDGVLFEKTTKTLIFYPCAFTAKSYTIPEGIQFIGDYAFSDCSYLTSVSIPDSVSSIGDYAFSWCSLASISIPDSVTAIGNRAFYGCTSLTSISIPNTVSSIRDYAFAGCSLTSISIPDSVTTIGYRAFYGCGSLTSISIPNSVTSIVEEAFYGCASLTSISIPASVVSIGDNTFKGCSNITLTVPRASYAEAWCQNNNLPYTYPDAND